MILHINKSYILSRDQNSQIFFKVHLKSSQCFGTLTQPSHYLSTKPVMTQILTGPARVEWLWVNDFKPQGIPHGTRDPALVGMRGTSYQNMKYQSSLHRRVITGGSEKAARVSQRMNYLIGVIEFYISANVTWIMCLVCGFICYLWVELKLKISKISLSNQALKSVHPSLLSSCCWPWGVFIGVGQPLQHGEVRDSYLAWVRPSCGLSNSHSSTIAIGLFN